LSEANIAFTFSVNVEKFPAYTREGEIAITRLMAKKL
jgi:hypothetical protein